jgi:hypothetical protein
MKKNNLWLGILAIALIFGMTVAGCDGGGSNNNNNNFDTYTPPEQTPLTGTVSVTANVTVAYNGVETKRLTANVSGLNGTGNNYYFYQWLRDGAEISGARSSAYDVTTADYGKTLRVKVTYSGYSGEQFGEMYISV